MVPMVDSMYFPILFSLFHFESISQEWASHLNVTPDSQHLLEFAVPVMEGSLEFD